MNITNNSFLDCHQIFQKILKGACAKKFLPTFIVFFNFSEVFVKDKTHKSIF